MPTGFIYKCNNCSYAVTLSGIWEFYIDEFGLRKKYGHLGRSAEAKNAGVKGFSVLWYCLTCRSVRDVSVLEFHKSQNGPVSALMAYYDTETEHEEFEPNCDKCGGNLPDEIEGELCPKCNIGHFEESARFMS